MTPCERVMTSLVESLGREIEVENLADSCLVITPLLRPNFDHLQFYVENSQGEYIVSDEGETVADLSLHGIDITAEKPILDEITKIALSHQVQFRNYVLSAKANEQNVGTVALRLLNAMQAISYLVYKLSSGPHSKFVNQSATRL